MRLPSVPIVAPNEAVKGSPSYGTVSSKLSLF